MWFLLVSVTPAVGLDPGVYPATWGGKLFIFLLIPLGILFLAMPLSTVGKNFNDVWQERQLVKLQRLVRQLLVENGMDASDCKLAFAQFDTDDSGEISWREFATCVRDVLGLQLPRKELLALWHKLDDTRAGLVTLNQFVDAIFPNSINADELTGDAADADLGLGSSLPSSLGGSSLPSSLPSSLSSSLGGSLRFDEPAPPPSKGRHSSRHSHGGAPEAAALSSRLTALQGEMNAVRGEMSAVRAEVSRSNEKVMDELRRLSAVVSTSEPAAAEDDDPANRAAGKAPDRSPDARISGRLSA